MLRELLDDQEADLAALGEFVAPDGPGSVTGTHWFAMPPTRASPTAGGAELHARAAAVLERRAGAEADAEAEILSLHYLRAAGQNREAWRYARAAGEQATARFSNADALDFYRRALQAARGIDVPGDELSGVYESLGDVAERVGALVEASDAYRASAAQRGSRSRHRGSDVPQAGRDRGTPGPLHDRTPQPVEGDLARLEPQARAKPGKPSSRNCALRMPRPGFGRGGTETRFAGASEHWHMPRTVATPPRKRAPTTCWT